MNDLKTVRKTLLKQIEVLEAREGEIGKVMRQASEPDAEERAVALENADVLQGIDQQVVADLKNLRFAIERIDAGTFGICNRCGKPISKERLDALSYASTCLKCAE